VALIGIDVGGTKTLAVRAGPDGSVLDQRRVSTPQGSAGELIEALLGLVEELRDGDLAGLGVCLPGMVSGESGTLAFAPRPPLRQVPVRDLLAERTRLPVVVSNDANAATWAEHRIGAGAGHPDMLGLMAGTGLGCGVIVGGRLLQGANGFAAEVGTLVAGGHPYGRLEELASGSAIVRMGREAVDGGAGLLPPDDDSCSPDALTGSMVTEAARRGDSTARGILAAVGTSLGAGIAALVNVFDPSLVVVGGGAAAAGPLLLEPARAACAEHLYGAAERPPVEIVQAALEDEAGAVGAALLAAP
jgi:glucokinase